MAEHLSLQSAGRELAPHVLRRRRVLSRGWAIAAIAWSLVRTVLAWVLLGDYGLNPWAYLCVDLSTSIVLGQSMPRMVVGFVDGRRRTAMRWGVLTAIAYAIPDVYLFTSTERIPPVTVGVLVFVIATGLTTTGISVGRRIRSARAGVIQLDP
ncbi:MAG: hypothetical protein ACO3S5_09045 [Ilumatobacteraceae bacterium]